MSVLRTQLQGLARRPARLLLTGLAVLVAAFVVYAMILANQIMTRTVINSLSSTPEGTSLVIDAGERGVPAAKLAKLRRTTGVAEVAGRGEAYLRPSGAAEDEGFTLVSDPGTGVLGRVKVTSGTYPDGPNEVAVTTRTQWRNGVSPGATLTLVAEGRRTAPVVLTVTGVVEAQDDRGRKLYGPESMVAALGRDGFDTIDIRASNGMDVAALKTTVSKILPGTEVKTAAEIRAEDARRTKKDLSVLFAMASLLVLVSVFAAGLVATSTFRIVFAQRMRQLALLRAVGAGRGKLVRALAVEGLLVGFTAGAVGVAAAAAFGHLAPLGAKAFGIAVLSPSLPLRPAVAVVLGAMLVTLLAVLAPALAASKVSPLEALRTAATTGGRLGIGKLRMIVGVLSVAAAIATVAYVWTALPEPQQVARGRYDPAVPLLATFFSGAMAFLALLTLGPVVLRPILAVVGWPLKRMGPLGRLAVGGVGAAPRRAAAVSVVVALGVTLVGGFLVVASSVQTLMASSVALSSPADLHLVSGSDKTLNPAMVQELTTTKALKNVVPYRRLETTVPSTGGSRSVYQVTDVNLPALPATAKLATAAGSVRDIAPGEAFVFGDLAKALNAKVGDPIRLATRTGGTLTVQVALTMEDFGPVESSIIVSPSDLDKLGAPRDAVGVLADAAASGEDGRAAAINAMNDAGKGADVDLTVLADQRDEEKATWSAVIAIVLGMIGLTVIIAVVGVGTTTALSVVERVRESGLLRAVGVTRRSLRTMLTTEAGLYGVIGAAMGLLIGVPYAWLTVLAMGMEAPLRFPVFQLAGVFVLLAGLTAAAGFLPARRAAKVSPVAALRSDE